MEDGAFGLGSALIYPPGNYASTEELIEIAKAMSPYGGVYITHMRSEADQLLEATRRGDAHREGGRRAGRDLSPEGGGQAQLGEGGAGDREDRLGARRGARRAGEHVSVHGRRHRPRRVPAAVGVGGRKAVREPRGLREAREDPRGDRASDDATGRVSASSRRRRACCSPRFRNPENKKWAGQRLSEVDGGDGQGLAQTP